MSHHLFLADATALPLGRVVDLTVTSPVYGAGIDYSAGGDVQGDHQPRDAADGRPGNPRGAIDD